MIDFRNLDVTVSLKGEEWFAMMVKLANKPLSKQGEAILKRATKRLAQTIKAAADAAEHDDNLEIIP